MELKNIFENENEKPLDTIPEDGGYTAIFLHDCLRGATAFHQVNLRRITEMAAAAGTICTSIRGDSFWGAHAEVRSIIYPAEECPQRNTATPLPTLTATGIRNMPRQCYIMALGVNDLLGLHQRVGSCDDINSEDPDNRETFAYYYAKIIER